MNEPLFREAVIDLDAIAQNVRALRRRIPTQHFMAVVKADAYGHGMVESARAALTGGADWLGVADLTEALALREAGIGARILAWLHDPDADFAPAVREGIDIGVSSRAQLEQIARAQARSGADGPARIQLKLETGLSRNGLPPAEWFAAFAEARVLEIDGVVRVTGVFSHLSNASPEDDAAALALFREGLEGARTARLSPEVVHLAASAAAVREPDARFNLVRIGIALYGLSPAADISAAELGLRPAMTLRGRVAAVRRVPAGTGVSYDYTYRTEAETTLALVPLGYAEGVPRLASGRGPVRIAGDAFTVCGRVAMDQFVVDVGGAPVSVGDEVVLFGDPEAGDPGADDWARAAETINYEIVTRIGGRVVRTYRGPAEGGSR